MKKKPTCIFLIYSYIPHLQQFSPYIKVWQDFPRGPVVKNLPDNAGDMGWIPGLGRSHMPQGN